MEKKYIYIHRYDPIAITRRLWLWLWLGLKLHCTQLTSALPFYRH